MFLKPYLKLTPTSGDGPRGPHRATSYIRAMVGRGRDTEIRVYRRHESGRKEGPHARPPGRGRRGCGGIGGGGIGGGRGAHGGYRQPPSPRTPSNTPQVDT